VLSDISKVFDDLLFTPAHRKRKHGAAHPTGRRARMDRNRSRSARE
jgi:hypothetical protein